MAHETKTRKVKKNVLGSRGEALAFFRYAKSLIKNGTPPKEAVEWILKSDLNGRDELRVRTRAIFIHLVGQRRKELMRIAHNPLLVHEGRMVTDGIGRITPYLAGKRSAPKA